MRINSADMFRDSPPLRKRKKGKRLSFVEKCARVLLMINRNVDYHRVISGRGGWGFTMGQVASMTGYAPSTALLNDLFKMCDEGMLIFDTIASNRYGVCNHYYVFYLPSEFIDKPSVQGVLF